MTSAFRAAVEARDLDAMRAALHPDYLDELHAEGSDALIFEAKVNDRELNGLDYIRTDAEGLVTELWVMIRPLSGLSAVGERMRALLAASSSDGA